MKENKTYPIFVNWPGAEEGSMVQFSYDEFDEKGLRKTVNVWVKANEPVEVNKNVYDIWVNSIYNVNRKKTEEMLMAEKRIQGKGKPEVNDYMVMN